MSWTMLLPPRRAPHDVIAELHDADVVRLHAQLVASVRAAGDAELLREQDRVVTGAQLANALEQLPRVLVQRGLKPQQRVLVGVRHGIDALLVLLAALRCGAVVQLVDTGRSEHEQERLLAQHPPSWVFAEPLLYAASARTPVRGYLRRRGVWLTPLGRIDAQHVVVGRRRLLTPRRAESLAGLLATAGGDSIELPQQLDAVGAATVQGLSGGGLVSAVREQLRDVSMPPGDGAPQPIACGGFVELVAVLLCGLPAQVAYTEHRLDHGL